MRRSRPSLLEKQGIKIMSGAKVVNLDEKSDSIDATNGDGKGNIIKVIVDRGIAAVGVIGNVGNIGVEKLCLKIERGTIAIDDPCQTSVLGIYAIGDVAGPPMLAHKAEHEGVICIEAIKGLRQHPMDESMIPDCTYCSPQVASAGLTDQAPKDKKFDIRVGHFPSPVTAKPLRSARTRAWSRRPLTGRPTSQLRAHLVDVRGEQS